ncbi:MAG: gliding motility-associated C-terminal domain-containing protein [Saprospiraceae bacterium]|nr:gliding motility-associated C-terminal domain-containing protein [Saprospiraceae bacterium]
MLRVACFILLSVVLHTSGWRVLHAQDISGYWQGVLYQDFPTGTVYHPLSMNLAQNGTAITGTSEILWATDPAYYGIMSLNGTFDGSLFSFQELTILDQNPHPSASWCIKSGDLIYNDINQVLEGPWQASSCYPGTVELHRLTLLSDTIFCIGDTVRIEVTGINIRWYSDPALTNLLDTGNIFYPGITATDTFYVTQTHYFTESPPFPIQVIISNPGLDTFFMEPAGCGLPDGSVTLSATGGIPDYQFELDGGPFQSNPTFTGLAEGNYTISILDAHGCTASAQVQVLKSLPPQIDILDVPVIPCAMDTTSVSVFATGGTGALMYQLNVMPYQMGSVFNGLPYGNYTVIVSDEKACNDTATFFLDTLVPPIIINVVGISPICAATNGSLTILVSGGNGPLSYALSGTNFQASNGFGNLATGVYDIIIEDSLGCQVKDSFELLAVDSLVAIQTIITPSACGKANGNLVVQAQGTFGSLFYTLGSLPVQDNPTFENLQSGLYPLLVIDGNGCTGTDTILISEMLPPIIEIDHILPTRCGLSNGEMGLSVIHTLPVVYALNGGTTQASGYFPDLGPGVYTIQVTDTLGCSAASVFTIDSSSAPEIILLDIEDTACSEANGAITLQAQGGLSPLSYSVNGGSFQTLNSFESLASGNYTITVQDMDGCLSDTIVFIENNTGILPGSVTFSDSDCEGTSGQIEIVATGGIGILTYALNNGPAQNNGLFPNLAPGNYTLQIKDEAGCQLLVNQIIGEEPCDVFIPNSFSPNGDGINDVFRIYGPAHTGVMITRYSLFDRWGNQLYEQKNIPLDTQAPVWWDGTFRGKPLDNGVIVYVIELAFASGTNRIYKGDLQMLR